MYLSSPLKICLDNTIAHSMFNENVVQLYGDKLLEKDEDFFLNHDYDAIVSVRSNASKTIEIINKIKRYWVQLNEENRNIIWKYFRILILLSRKITNNCEFKFPTNHFNPGIWSLLFSNFTTRIFKDSPKEFS